MSNKLKEKLYHKMLEILEEKIIATQSAIESVKESRANETKSSMGDKYETSTEMIQQEIDRNNLQLGEAKKVKYILSQIDIKKTHKKVGPGCLVETNLGSYFIAVSLGKIEIENQPYYCVSPAAPLSRFLLNKEVNDTGSFNGKEYKIVGID